MNRKLLLNEHHHKNVMMKSIGYCLLIISILGLLNLGAGLAYQANNVTIGNSGNVVYISSLHVEGAYIKDISGNIVNLDGVNKAEFADQPGGTWMGQPVYGYASWNPANVRAELAQMKQWGITTIRCHQAVEHWEFDMGQHRQIIKDFLSIAGEYGMYVVYDGYCVRDYWDGASQDPLPYPPYQTSANASQVIGSEQDFIDWWVSIATELKSFPNVIFELWNEPSGNATAEQSWQNVSQRCINAIRATGSTQLIIVQWGMGVWVNLNSPPPANPAATMDWVWQFNLTDPTGNLVYSTHIYRSYNAFHYTSPSFYRAWNYTDIQLAFQYFEFPQLTAQHPLFIGEIGCDLSTSGTEQQHELEAFDNCLKLFNIMGIGYTPYWWRQIGSWRLHSGPPDFVPNDAGQILINNLKG